MCTSTRSRIDMHCTRTSAVLPPRRHERISLGSFCTVLLLILKRFLLLLALIWPIHAFSSRSESTSTSGSQQEPSQQQQQQQQQHDSLLPPMLSPFGAYPNLLHVSEEQRRQFHSVIVVDPSTSRSRQRAVVVDLTKSINPIQQLATPEEWQWAKQQQQEDDGTKTSSFSTRSIHDEEESPSHETCAMRQQDHGNNDINNNHDPYTIGRYDEDRIGMYESDLFVQDDHGNIIPSQDRRTVHVGLDLGAPAGDAVHAFWHGTVHAAGYNPALGDYGHVVVLKHIIPPLDLVVYALYGHLHRNLQVKALVPNNATGADSDGQEQAEQLIRAGQVIGFVGDVADNGGWRYPHVHFQLSMTPPSTHDMPGVVRRVDRALLLYQYPDPRYCLPNGHEFY